MFPSCVIEMCMLLLDICYWHVYVTSRCMLMTVMYLCQEYVKSGMCFCQLYVTVRCIYCCHVYVTVTCMFLSDV